MNKKDINNFFEKISPDENQKLNMYIEIKRKNHSNFVLNYKFLKLSVSVICSIGIIIGVYSGYYNKNLIEQKNIRETALLTQNTLSENIDNNDNESNKEYGENSNFDDVNKFLYMADLESSDLTAKKSESITIKNKLTMSIDEYYNYIGINVMKHLNIPSDLNDKTDKTKAFETDNEGNILNPEWVFSFENKDSTRKITVTTYKEKSHNEKFTGNMYVLKDVIFKVESLNITDEELKKLINY